MARRARKKLDCYTRVLIAVSSLIFMIVLCMTITISILGASEEISARSSEAKSGSPDITFLMSWGHGGSGVIVEQMKLLENGHQKDFHGLRPSSPFFLWIAPSSDKADIQAGYAVYGLNEYLSNRISLRRPLPDMRERPCLGSKTRALTPEPPGSKPRAFPNASVIIVFSKEPRSVLLRTIFSVLDRSPPDLLKEIILVDFGSTHSMLGYPELENYLSAISTKVHVIRSKVATSYPKAVNLGATHATGTVAVFLRARSECTLGWLQPLLFWLTRNPLSIAVPVVDVIDGDTFQYKKTPMSEMTIGSFSWDMTITRRKTGAREENSRYTMPESNPVIADGIFAMNRKLFLESGGLTESISDLDLLHLEFSFKSWMCGHPIQLVPCSRVGLVSLPSAGSTLVSDEIEKTDAEKLMIILSWLGEYQPFAYERLGLWSKTSKQKLGSHEVILDNNNHLNHPRLERSRDCLDFRWFLAQVEPQKLVIGRLLGSGHLQQQQQQQHQQQQYGGDMMALTVVGEIGTTDTPKVSLKKHQILSNTKHARNKSVDTPEFWYLTDNGLLRTENNLCMHPQEKGRLPVAEQMAAKTAPQRISISRTKTAMIHILTSRMAKSSGSKDGGREQSGNSTRPDFDIVMVRCEIIPSPSRWTFTKTSSILHSPSDKCLESHTLDNSTFTVRLAACDEHRVSQRWRFSHRQPSSPDEPVVDLAAL